MNIQIFGKKKCFDTKKAERFFKERRIKYQFIDIIDKGFSGGEIKRVLSSLKIEELVDQNNEFYQESGVADLKDANDIADCLYDYYEIVRTPIVTNGKKATAGNQAEIWQQWIKDEK